MRSILGFNPLSLLAFSHDVCAAAFAWLVAYWLRLNLEIPAPYFASMLNAMLVCIPIQAVANLVFGLYRGVWRFASIHDLRRILLAVGVSAAIAPVALVALQLNNGIPRSVFLLEPVLLLLVMAGNRLAYRSWKEHKLFGAARTQGRPVLVFGSGDAAVTLLKELSRSTEWRVVGLISDDRLMIGRAVQQVRVLAASRNLAELSRSLGVADAIIARPDALPSERRRLVERCRAAQLNVLTVPSFDDLMSGKVQVSAIRQIELDDLLGRSPVVLDTDGLKGLLSNRTVMISGAGGSIGSELTRQIARFAPAELLLLENSEFALYSIEQEIMRIAPGQAFTCAIGDVRDASRMEQLLARHRPAVVFHAAAYKHVPLMELDNARQALTNNVAGTAVLVPKVPGDSRLPW